MEYLFWRGPLHPCIVNVPGPAHKLFPPDLLQFKQIPGCGVLLQCAGIQDRLRGFVSNYAAYDREGQLWRSFFYGDLDSLPLRPPLHLWDGMALDKCIYTPTGGRVPCQLIPLISQPRFNTPNGEPSILQRTVKNLLSTIAANEELLSGLGVSPTLLSHIRGCSPDLEKLFLQGNKS